MKKFLGFTIAEVLLTTVIIGIIAAITVPVLMDNISDNRYKHLLKKNFSNFSNALSLMNISEYEDFKDWDYARTDKFLDDTYKYFSQYMVISKYCGRKQQGCFTRPKAKNGSYATFSTNYGFSDNNPVTFVLNDGTQVGFDFWYARNIKNVMGVEKDLLHNDANFVIAVDVNGYKKPNVTGKDVFAFVLTEKGLVPAGKDNNSQNCGNKGANHNYDCTAKLLI